MKDLATHRVSTARAKELFTILKEKYELTDDDLPGMSDLIETAKKGKVVDSTDDLETRLATLRADITKEVEEKFTKTLIPELGSMASLPIIWTAGHPEGRARRRRVAARRMGNQVPDQVRRLGRRLTP